MLWAGPTFTGPVEVTIDFGADDFTVRVEECERVRPKGLSGDIDNLSKAVLDALQKDGGAYTDDRLVQALDARFVGGV